MILADTSVWVGHLREGDAELGRLLEAAQVVCHPWVNAELALGTLRARETVLALLDGLPSVPVATVDEMRGMIDTGITFLRGREPDWGSGNLFTVHNWWHLALYLLEAGRVDDALAVRIGPHVVPLGDDGVRALPGVELMVGRRVALGFRPESVRRDPNGPIVVSPTFTEGRGVDQLVTARLEANDVRETADGIVVSEDASSMIHVAMPTRDVIDIWKPLPLAIDMATIRLFDLVTGQAICRPQPALSTTCPASMPSSGR